MVRIAGDVLADILSMGRGKRAQVIGLSAMMQISRLPEWSRHRMTVKNMPYTAWNPHPGQIETRLVFGRYARDLRGVKGKKALPEPGRKVSAGTLVPAAAAEMQSRMRGTTASQRLSPEEYPSKRRSLRTLEELMEYAEQIGAPVR